MLRGEIWWATLPRPIGSEPAKRRPVLVIQDDSFNRSNLETVICAMITSNISAAYLPGNLLLEKGVSGLEKTSAVNFSQITTIDKSDLTHQISMLPRNMITKINACLKLVLNID